VLKINVVLAAEFEGPAHDAFEAASRATGAGLDVTWTGGGVGTLRFVARPHSALSWDEATRLVEAVSRPWLAIA
jgi:hypothetical protein